MLVFRIALAKYAKSLMASGRAGRWNFNDVKVIYTASSQSLACLENVVHRSKLGLSANFCVLTIDVPATLEIAILDMKKLPKNWQEFENTHLTQAIGNKWIEDNKTAVCCVPSSIIASEFNFLINPNHPDFKYIKHLKTEPFMFDDRIKD